MLAQLREDTVVQHAVGRGTHDADGTLQVMIAAAEIANVVNQFHDLVGQLQDAVAVAGGINAIMVAHKKGGAQLFFQLP